MSQDQKSRQAMASTDVDQPDARRVRAVEAVVVLATITITCTLLWIALLPVESDSDDDPPPPALLAQQQTSELLTLARTENVCREILRRDDVSAVTLQASLIRLARLRQLSQPEMLADLVVNADKDADDKSLQNFSRLHDRLPAETRETIRDRMVEIVSTGNTSIARRVAFAVWISIDGDGHAAFEKALPDDELLNDLLKALPLVASRSVQKELYDNVRPFLADLSEAASGNNEVRELAIDVMVKLSGRESEKASDLIRLLAGRRSEASAISGLAALPPESWPEDQLGILAAGIIAWLAELPVEQRKSPDATVAFDLGQRVSERLEEEKRARLQQRLAELANEVG